MKWCFFRIAWTSLLFLKVWLAHMLSACIVNIFLNIKYVPVEKNTDLARVCSYLVSVQQGASNLHKLRF